VPPGRSFELFEGTDERSVGVVSSAQLTQGITVTLPEKDGAKVLLIKPAAGDAAK
jgi:hypothetical protein